MSESVSADGVVVWFTGLPSSGKTTLALRVAAELRRASRPCLVLDGDEVRRALTASPTYDEAAREAFYKTLARLAALSAAQGLIVLVPATANRRAYRQRARELTDRLIEVFVDTPLDECIRRDSKGLYARASAGDVSDMPGSTGVYESPERADVIVRPDTADGVRSILDELERVRA